MKRVIMTCDVCGTEIETRGRYAGPRTGRLSGYVGLDLCIDCSANAWKLIAEAHRAGDLTRDEVAS